MLTSLVFEWGGGVMMVDSNNVFLWALRVQIKRKFSSLNVFKASFIDQAPSERLCNGKDAWGLS